MSTVTAYLAGGPNDGAFITLNCDLLGAPPLAVRFLESKAFTFAPWPMPVAHYQSDKVFEYRATGRTHLNGAYEYKCES